MEQKLSIGRIVIFIDMLGNEHPAIITKVIEGNWVNLHVFYNLHSGNYHPFDIFKEHIYKQCDTVTISCWKWPERV